MSENRVNASAPNLPSHAPDGEFNTFQTWVNKAQSWIGGTNSLCADAKGRICECGGDMMRARDENAFPVRYWFGEGRQTAAQQRRSARISARARFQARSEDEDYAERMQAIRETCENDK